MPTIKITDATVEPVTLAEVKLALRIDDVARDLLLTGYITAARQELEGLLLRTLIETTLELVLDGFPPAHQPAIQLWFPRVRSIVSVKYLDETGVEETLDSQDYRLDSASEPGWLVPAVGKAWPSTQDVVNAVRVRYLAGFGVDASAVPQSLKTWILLRVSQLDQGCAEEHTEAMARSGLLAGHQIFAV